MSAGYEPQGYCPQCGYRMDIGVCPECGRRVTWPVEFPPHHKRKRIIKILTGLALLSMAAGTIGYYRSELAYRFWPLWHLRQLARGTNPSWAVWAKEIMEFRYRQRLPALRAQAAAREANIRAEIAKLGEHQWAGDYGSGSLVLAPRSGFVYRQGVSLGGWGVGAIEYWSYGEVIEVAPDQIVLRCEFDAGDYGYPSPRELIRVGQFTNRYLIEPAKIVQLCKTFRGTGKWSNGLRREPEPETVTQLLPSVPQEYRKYILPPPHVYAEITEVNEAASKLKDGRTAYRIQVTLNIGRRYGVHPGMKLDLIHPSPYGRVEITQVDETTCRGLFYAVVHPKQPHWLPRAGWQFSTYSPTPGLSAADEAFLKEIWNDTKNGEK